MKSEVAMFLKFDALGPGAYTQRKLGRCLARAFDGGEYSQSRLLWVDAVEKGLLNIDES
jgi:hypothetical protein